MFSAFKIAASTALFSFSSLFVIDALAKPQNARSRIYNEFHTDLFAKEPPLRSECPSWKDVVKGDTFDNEAFSALSKNGRPCFVNRGKYAYDIADFSGNTAFGRNFAVYRTDKPNHYEVDFALEFYTGKLSGDRDAEFAKFKNRFSSCIKNNPILLNDGNRFLKINVPIILKNQDKNKHEKYKDADLDKNIFGINLFDKLKINNIKSYSIKIPCHTIVHELLHISGLHDIYKSRFTYTVKNSISDKIKQKIIFEKCKSANIINCDSVFKNQTLVNSILAESGLIKIKKYQEFDCRNPKDYQPDGSNESFPNIMNFHKIFDLINLPISVKVCKTDKPTEDKYTNREQKQCDQQDKQLLSAAVSIVDKIKNVHRHADSTLKLKKSEYYIAYYDRRDTNELPPSLTREQFSSILYSNNLDHPEVREFARIAKNTYRNKYGKGAFGGCRR